jgi:tetratricopeptide (TPR) repeat protein
MSSNARIVLLTMVKNEEKNMKRLINAVKGWIDGVIVCDTGSTDKTVSLTTSTLGELNIPGKVYEYGWENFGKSRTKSFECFQEWVTKDTSWDPSTVWGLLLDADMVLEVKNFDKSILTTADSFHILQGNDSFYYQNLRIVKNNGLYKYCGVTHEYIDIPNKSTIQGFEKNKLFIRDIGDGGAKQNKFERDISLLLDGIKDEPNNVRYYFYLANSYHDLGRFGEAINIYNKRIELGGWKEEVWYSYYRIGLCYKKMNKINDAIKYWLDGFEYYPERLEGLHEIIMHYRIVSKQKLANLFYQQAVQILNLNHDRN